MTTPQQLLEQLQQAERDSQAPASEIRDRLWSELESRLVNGPAPPELDQAPLLANTGSVVLAVVGAVVVAGVLGVVGLGLGLGDEPGAAKIPARASDSVVGSTSVPALVDPAQPVEPPLAEAPPDEAPPVETGAAPPSPSPAPRPDSKPDSRPDSKPDSKPNSKPMPPAQPRTFADEVTLVQALSTALKRGDSALTLRLVAEHERDFADGQFIEERRAAKARGLCQAGKLAAGRAQAERFASRWPTSIHLAGIEQDCADPAQP